MFLQDLSKKMEKYNMNSPKGADNNRQIIVCWINFLIEINLWLFTVNHD